MNFGFVSCVHLGFDCIKSIYKTGRKIELIISLDDEISQSKSGRIYLDEFCELNSIPLLKIKNINSEIVVKKIKEFNIDWLFIIGWSQIASSNVIKAPKLGAIGAHPTLLPKGRGRASIPWAIIKDLRVTGVTFFRIDKGVDTGPIIYQKKINLTENETATSLYKKVCLTHSEIIYKLIPLLENNNFKEIRQNNNEASFWPGRKPEDGQLDLKGSIYDAERIVRATTRPYPGAFFIKSNKKIIIWKAKISNFKISDSKYIEFKDGFLILEDYTIHDIY